VKSTQTKQPSCCILLEGFLLVWWYDFTKLQTKIHGGFKLFMNFPPMLPECSIKFVNMHIWFMIIWTNLTSCALQYHNSAPSPLTTSQVSKPLSKIFSHYVVFVFSPSQLSCFLTSHSLPSWCSLVPLCFVFTWKPSALTSKFP